MAELRRRPKRGLGAPFGLGILALILIAGEIGYLRLIALLARQPAVVALAHASAIVSPSGAVHPATFGIAEPINVATPAAAGYVLASVVSTPADITGSIHGSIHGPILGEADLPQVSAAAAIDRTRKGDRLIPAMVAEDGPAARPEPGSGASGRKGNRLALALPAEPEAPSGDQQGRKSDRLVMRPRLPGEPDDELSAEPPTELSAELPRIELEPAEPAVVEDEGKASREPPAAAVAGADLAAGFAAADDLTPDARLARLYFGVRPMGQTLQGIMPWEEGPAIEGSPASLDPQASVAALPREPVEGMPGAAPDAAKTEAAPDTAKMEAALDTAKKQDKLPAGGNEAGKETLAKSDVDARTGGQMIAAKGEVTGESQRPMSPAERLGLDGSGRASAEKCLAAAIYFEARGESVRGQIAVAQVVLNRAFSGYYPHTICGVVYQNANRHLRCQFTFACDGIRDVVREPEAMARAKKIAAMTLDGQLWLPEVGKATHYHAYWVRPSWVREMTKMYKLGVHTFYRPRRWGDGSDEPEWGDPAATAAAAKEL